ncbi:MAG: cobalt-precorrin-4 C(11)-methyltransferase [Candidatus Acididesulfobacter guangdongensis]|uniref:Cobalt-precorrin-4 C(11)-methyltransferase n=1 Tax=Acididesulfobacter guangdongensis TaxID=2597225 RepID=A0A519BFM9_ACIG2|nr:MAG: cobalt-precorrin-4 C(11)-methyltransferase [Candidatus Acididesulfobacter guangdongensis]
MDMQYIEKYKIYFIGAGPGDPELLTVKAYKILLASGCVFYAGSLINKELLKIPGSDCILYDMSGMCFEEIAEKIAMMYDAGTITSVLHAGDSSLYSSISEQAALLEIKQANYEIIPGVTAAFAACASNKSTLTLPDVSQTVIFCRAAGRTGKLPDGQDIKSLASHKATMAIYLSFGLIDSVVSDLLESYDENTYCLIAKDVSLKSEILIECKLKDVLSIAKARSIKNMAVLLVGNALAGKYSIDHKSKLYDENFFHTFRKAKESR